jgi:cytochrome c oxidase subunit 2
MGNRLPLFPEAASSMAGHVDAFYWFLIGVSAFFAVLIAALVLFFAIKYRRRPGSAAMGEIAHGSNVLELAWTVIPFLLAMVMFGWSATLYVNLSRAPDDALELYATGKQWMWKLQHKDGQREINELHVPVGRAIRLKMTSEDVIHSFYVPAFRVKMDVLPGRYTQIWFRPTKVGKYHLFCAEYCGTKHSGMIGWIHVLEPADYQRWLQGGAGEGTLAQRGQKLFEELGCVNCHHTDGKGRGPNIENVFGTVAELEGGGKVKIDEGYIRESILNPQAKIVSGYKGIMPTFQGLVSEDQIIQLIEYIKSTTKKPEPKKQDGAAPAPKPAAAAEKKG